MKSMMILPALLLSSAHVIDTSAVGPRAILVGLAAVPLRGRFSGQSLRATDPLVDLPASGMIGLIETTLYPMAPVVLPLLMSVCQRLFRPVLCAPSPLQQSVLSYSRLMAGAANYIALLFCPVPWALLPSESSGTAVDGSRASTKEMMAMQLPVGASSVKEAVGQHLDSFQCRLGDSLSEMFLNFR